MIKTLRNLLKQDKERFVVPRGVQDVIPIMERNRWMVTNSDVLVAYMRNKSGGTAACVRMAE